jgi:peptide/bleomycin uptake transporter
MFRSFFANRAWMPWSVLGTGLILVVTWYKVQLDVRINEWFGTFYNTIQEALGNPGKVQFEDFLGQCLTFAEIAGLYIVIAVALEFFVGIEGAAQRVQEDTMRFARIMESLGVAFLRSLMTLAAFLPILWVLSDQVKELPWIGPVDQALVFLAILSSIIGTLLLALVGIKLPGLEFNNQKVEAAYRKELVLGEDLADRAEPTTVSALYRNVRTNYFTLFKHYLYFDIAKWSYLQFSVIVPYIALGPTIVSGAITLGVLQQILRAFGKVEESFQFLVNSWSTIVELMSIYKRLNAFEKNIRGEPVVEFQG